MPDAKALDALALALAKRVNDLATGENDVFICVRPGEDCPPGATVEDAMPGCDRCLAEYLLTTGRDAVFDCNRCLADHLLPTLREELAAYRLRAYREMLAALPAPCRGCPSLAVDCAGPVDLGVKHADCAGLMAWYDEMTMECESGEATLDA